LNEALLLVGIGCIIAAAVGGGLSLANLKVPVVNSVPRQVLLAGIGVAIIVGSLLLPEKVPADGGPKQPATPGLPNQEPAEITLSAGSAPKGSKVGVNGSGFQTGELVEIRVHITSVGTARADSQGAFTQQVTIPQSAPPPGFPTSIFATGHSSGKTATAPFEVADTGGKTGTGSGSSNSDCTLDGTPGVTLSAATAKRGSSLNVFGTGFCAGELVDIRLHASVVGSAVVDSNGRFTQEVTVPQSAPPPGFPTDVSATGRESARTGSAPFSTA
jgi:hypothetical protein